MTYTIQLEVEVTQTNELAQVSCEICQADSLLWARISGYSHYRCHACSHLFVFPRPDQLILDEFYQSGKYYDVAARQFERLQNEACFRVGLLSKIADHYDLAHRLLDVGCASGIFLQKAQQMGWSVSGSDRSAAIVSVAREKVVCQIHIGILEEMQIPGAPFEIVTAWEVLEHAIDPRAFFRALSENVQEGGLLAISTPLGNGLIARLLGARFPMLTPPEHLSLFSQQSLERLAGEFGFSQVAFRSFSNLGVRTLASGISKLVFRKPLQDCNVFVRASTMMVAVCLAWIPPLIDAAKQGSEMEVIFYKRPSRAHIKK
jgi:SAM-dependent methyltransferase